jgi:hypothetical protein
VAAHVLVRAGPDDILLHFFMLEGKPVVYLVAEEQSLHFCPGIVCRLEAVLRDRDAYLAQESSRTLVVERVAVGESPDSMMLTPPVDVDVDVDASAPAGASLVEAFETFVAPDISH